MFQVVWDEMEREKYYIISKTYTEKYLFYKTVEFFMNEKFITDYIDKYCKNYTLEELKARLKEAEARAQAAQEALEKGNNE